MLKDIIFPPDMPVPSADKIGPLGAKYVDNAVKTVDKSLEVGKTRSFVRIMVPTNTPIYGGITGHDPTIEKVSRRAEKIARSEKFTHILPGDKTRRRYYRIYRSGVSFPLHILPGASKFTFLHISPATTTATKYRSI